MSPFIRRLAKPIPVAVTTAVLVAVVVAAVVAIRGSTSASAISKKEFAVAIDASCFDAEQVVPTGAPPTGAAALGSYLDKVLPLLRHADDAGGHIALPRGEQPLARRYLARFHDYVTAVSRYRDAIRNGTVTADAAAASAVAHAAFSDLLGMAEPLDSSYCPPQPQLP